MASEADALLTNALNGKIQQAVRNQLKPLQDEINQLTRKTDKRDGKRETQAASLLKNDAELKQLKESMLILHEEFDAAAKTYAQKDTEFAQSIQGMQAQSINVAESISSIEGQIAQVHRLLNERLLENEQTTKDLAALHVRVDALEKRSKNTSKVSLESSALRTEVDGLKDQITSFPIQLFDILSKVRAVENDIVTLRASPKVERVCVPPAAIPSTHGVECLPASPGGDQEQSTLPNASLDTTGADQRSAAPAEVATQQSGLDSRKTASSSTIQATGHNPTSLGSKVTKNAVPSALPKANHARPNSASVEPSPSRSMRSVSSDGTVIPDSFSLLTMASRRKQAAQASKLRIGGMLPTEASTERVKENNECLHDSLVDEQMVKETQPEELIIDNVADGNLKGADEVLSDHKPITKLERDLYRQDWYTAGKPGKLDDFVRLQRTCGVSYESVRNPRKAKAPNQADMLTQKPKAKRMSKHKRCLDEDVSTGDIHKDLLKKNKRSR